MVGQRKYTEKFLKDKHMQIFTFTGWAFHNVGEQDARFMFGTNDPGIYYGVPVRPTMGWKGRISVWGFWLNSERMASTAELKDLLHHITTCKLIIPTLCKLLSYTQQSQDKIIKLTMFENVLLDPRLRALIEVFSKRFNRFKIDKPKEYRKLLKILDHYV